jgi:hypothetical protein
MVTGARLGILGLRVKIPQPPPSPSKSRNPGAAPGQLEYVRRIRLR